MEMSSGYFKLLTASVLGTVLMSGCAAHHEHVVVAPSGAVIVTERPPPAQHEVRPVAPGPNYFWVHGYWSYHNARWLWVPGQWEARPRPGVAWVSGHWSRTEGGWFWTPGHWD
ncbi:MAG: hypothetical protein C5B50_17235 [Verrucomicrobia bacterium]|nr:MAG: hypothetical protein C5B50_17235 [Verrucomicrobiota bacterium]